MKKKILINKVMPDSAATDAGLEPGDMLLSVNGQSIVDIFDYRFLTADSRLLLEIEKKNGELWEIDIEKDEYEDIGLEFEDPLISEARHCSNKCIFCFIDQLPRGMRETVYFKDDDTRLSFLMGNYVTLTNMKEEEIERIIRYRMTPVNVSVHTTDPELRAKMLGNRFAGDVLEKITVLTEGGITVNAQIVLCKGINDGPQLNKTIDELSALYPGIDSISVVPVGLTKWREGLHPLEAFTSGDAAEVIKQVSLQQKKLLDKYSTRLIYLADEFYIKAGMDLPAYDEYEDFPQIENGVGLMSLLSYEFEEYLSKHAAKLDRLWAGSAPRTVSIATGRCAADYIKKMAQALEKRYNGLQILVYPIENDYFGENVTVTGLLTGKDIYDQLKSKYIGSELLISRSMLKANEELFLDDYTVEGLSRELKVRVTIVENHGNSFVDKIMGIN